MTSIGTIAQLSAGYAPSYTVEPYGQNGGVIRFDGRFFAQFAFLNDAAVFAAAMNCTVHTTGVDHEDASTRDSLEEADSFALPRLSKLQQADFSKALAEDDELLDDVFDEAYAGSYPNHGLGYDAARSTPYDDHSMGHGGARRSSTRREPIWDDAY